MKGCDALSLLYDEQWGSSMKVLVTSNHNLLGNSLVAMLEHAHAPHGERIEVSLSDPVSVTSRLQEFMVDIVLVEAITSLRDGIATLRDIKDLFPNICVVMLCMADDDASVYESILAGADGYITHDVPSTTLVATLIGLMKR